MKFTERVTIQMKAIKKFCAAVLFIVLGKVVNF